jgi:hypothetical protein
VHEHGLDRLAAPGLARLRIDGDGERQVAVRACVHVQVAATLDRVYDRHGGDATQHVVQRPAAALLQQRDRLVLGGQLTQRVVAGPRDERHGRGWEPGRFNRGGRQLGQQRVRARRRGRALEDRRVAGAQRERRGLDGGVRPAVEGPGHHAQRHSALLHAQPAWELTRREARAHRVGERGHLVAVRGERQHPPLVELRLAEGRVGVAVRLGVGAARRDQRHRGAVALEPLGDREYRPRAHVGGRGRDHAGCLRGSAAALGHGGLRDGHRR